MTIFETIAVSIISSTVVLGIFTFIIKKYVGQWITFEFEKRKWIYKRSIDQQFKASDYFLDNQLGIYPEILELIYRLKNMLRECLKLDMAYKWNPDLRVLCFHLTENIYKYRVFISDGVFNDLHKFKHIIQDAIVFHDTYTRNDYLLDKDGYMGAKIDIENKLNEAEKLFKNITNNIQEIANIKK